MPGGPWSKTHDESEGPGEEKVTAGKYLEFINYGCRKGAPATRAGKGHYSGASPLAFGNLYSFRLGIFHGLSTGQVPSLAGRPVIHAAVLVQRTLTHSSLCTAP